MRMLSRLASILLFTACHGGVDEGAPEVYAEPGVTELAVWDEDAWQIVPEIAQIESAHPYGNRERHTWTLEAPACARAVRLRFSLLDLEDGHDYLVLRDEEGNAVQALTGHYASATSQPIPGRVVRLQLITDASVTGSGFTVSAVEAVEGSLMCPAIAIPRCADGTVDVNGPEPMCSCPRMPTCESLEGFSATLLVGGGFTGASRGHTLTGDGRVSTVQQAPGAEPEVEWVANMPPYLVQDIARRLVFEGFFETSGVSGEAGNMTSSFTATFRGVTRTVQWPAGSAPAGEAERFAEAINQLRKSVTCEAEEEGVASECREGYECLEGACVARSQASCATVLCAPGSHCELRQVTCVRAPCDPVPQCVADEGYCDAPSDCEHLPHVMCVGAWECAAHQCSYSCAPEPTESWQREAADFGSGSPYEDDAYLGWRLSGPTGTQAVRVSFASFDLEDGYDYVVLYDWAWSEVARYSGALGAFVSASVEGSTAYVVFSSDASITRSGFRVDAVDYLVP